MIGTVRQMKAFLHLSKGGDATETLSSAVREPNRRRSENEAFPMSAEDDMRIIRRIHMEVFERHNL
jgi:hypothetical protein